ncbi:MAG: zinc metallopeptidase [Planctomycetota bacterium]|jgi:Zn-dependent membrane protease YugP
MIMWYFDPIYWILLIGIAALSGVASLLVKSTFSRYSKIPTQSGMSGRDVAVRILRDNGIHDVEVEAVGGSLTDHYDPRKKKLRLSEPVYGGRSMAAFGVAAHEVGHAIQDARGYAPLKFRSAWVPVANLGNGLSFIVILLAFFMGGAATTMGTYMAWAGVGLFGCMTLFTFITLPVEFDASRRALQSLAQGGYTTEAELLGAKKVLTAAALTYVAAFVGSLLMLLYWAYRLGLFGGRR